MNADALGRVDAGVSAGADLPWLDEAGWVTVGGGRPDRAHGRRARSSSAPCAARHPAIAARRGLAPAAA